MQKFCQGLVLQSAGILLLVAGPASVTLFILGTALVILGALREISAMFNVDDTAGQRTLQCEELLETNRRLQFDLSQKHQEVLGLKDDLVKLTADDYPPPAKSSKPLIT